MKVNYDRFFINAEYKKPYNDYTSEKFIALSTCKMALSFSDLLETEKEWRKDKKLKNITFSMIPKNTLSHYNITK